MAGRKRSQARAERSERTVRLRLQRLTGLLERLAESGIHDASVLDWDTGLRWSRLLPGHAVFSPVAETFEPVLPYLDGAVDVVLMPAAQRARLPEARRVARWAVVVCDQERSDPEQAILVEWLREPLAQLARSSIVIPAFGRPDLVLQSLDAITEATPERLPWEIIVVDDSRDDETWEALVRVAPSLPRLRMLRNERNLGFGGSCNRGAVEATGEIVIFLNQDAEPLPGWLPPLLRLFADPAVGAAGSLLVGGDGRLQESGGVVFRDGSAANFGRGLALDDPLVTTVREVHYCSAAALATRREMFLRLGGFDERYAPAYYEDTDYAMSVREAGCAVVRQPESVVVHHEGSVNGRDLRRGGKRQQAVNQDVFVRKWAERLADFPERPKRFDRAAWVRLAAAGLTEGGRP